MRLSRPRRRASDTVSARYDQTVVGRSVSETVESRTSLTERAAASAHPPQAPLLPEESRAFCGSASIDQARRSGRMPRARQSSRPPSLGRHPAAIIAVNRSASSRRSVWAGGGQRVSDVHELCTRWRRARRRSSVGDSSTTPQDAPRVGAEEGVATRRSPIRAPGFATARHARPGPYGRRRGRCVHGRARRAPRS